MRALANDGATASRQEQPCTTPDELAKAVAAMPRIRPPEPTFTAPPEYQRTTYQQGTYGRPAGPGNGVVTPPVVVPPAPLQSRTGKALKWAVSALLIAALGLGSWQLAETLLDRDKGSDDPGTTQTNPENGDEPKPRPAVPLKIAGATEFTPSGSGISQDEAPNTVDGKPGTSWITPQYRGFPNFGNIDARKDGSGVVVDLGSVQDVSGVDVTMYRSGQKAEVLAADENASAPSSLSDFPQHLTQLGTAGSSLKESLAKPVRTRYILIHITELPQDDTGSGFRGGISEISVLG